MTGDLTSLANVKAWLSIQTDTDDVVLSRLISSASQYIQSWLNRLFASQTYTERRGGTGTDVMAFADYPVTAVTSVIVDGSTIPLSNGISYGYLFDDKFLYFIGGRFGMSRMNVQLTYTAGYASVPLEIEQSCIELIGIRYKERQRIGENSKSIGGETVSFDVKDMPNSVKTILNNYRKVIPL
jgi:hypothetical protein